MRFTVIGLVTLSCLLLGECLETKSLLTQNLSPLMATQDLREKQFLGLGIIKLKIKFVICYFVAKCSWPQYPQSLFPMVQSTSRDIFAKSDSYIQAYCDGIFIIIKICRPSSTTTKAPNTTSTTTTTVPTTAVVVPETTTAPVETTTAPVPAETTISPTF